MIKCRSRPKGILNRQIPSKDLLEKLLKYCLLLWEVFLLVSSKFLGQNCWVRRWKYIGFNSFYCEAYLDMVSAKLKNQKQFKLLYFTIFLLHEIVQIIDRQSKNTYPFFHKFSIPFLTISNILKYRHCGGCHAIGNNSSVSSKSKLIKLTKK